MFADEFVNRIKEIFSTVYKSADCPENMAAFVRHESKQRLHCEVKIYLSPDSTIVANKINALKCGKPYPDDLHLLAGSANSWKSLFPEYTRK